MTIEIARHLRIVRADLDDSFVEKRNKAIVAIAKAFRKKTAAADVLALAGSLITILLSSTLDAPDEVTKQVSSALSTEAPSFVAEGAKLEIAVCALLACAVVLDAEKSSKDVKPALFARALALGLEAVPQRPEPRIQTLKIELEDLAISVAKREAETGRRRVTPADVPPRQEGEAPDAYSTRLIEAVAANTRALGRNAELDREELDTLWWAFNGRSEFLECPIADAEARAAAVTSGVELACLLKHSPMEAHRQIATRWVSKGESVELRELASIESDAATKIVAKIGAAATDYPAVFPLLSALSWAAAGRKEGVAPGTLNGQARPLTYWARRALDEASLSRSVLGG